MTYKIYVDGEYDNEFGFIIDVLNYINQIGLTICDEVEHYEQHYISIYC